MISCPECGEPMTVISGIRLVRLIRCENCGRVINLRSLRVIPGRLYTEHGSQLLREAVGL